jgi:cysteinyl-tRNA synthetase
MDDDFNTGGSTADLFELMRVLNKYVDDNKLEASKPDAAHLAVLRQGAKTLRELGATVGMFRAAPAKAGGGGDDELVGKLMKLLLDLRASARGKKDFVTADQIRNTLTEIGIALEDRPGGTEWTVK